MLALKKKMLIIIKINKNIKINFLKLSVLFAWTNIQLMFNTNQPGQKKNSIGALG